MNAAIICLSKEIDERQQELAGLLTDLHGVQREASRAQAKASTLQREIGEMEDALASLTVAALTAAPPKQASRTVTKPSDSRQDA